MTNATTTDDIKLPPPTPEGCRAESLCATAVSQASTYGIGEPEAANFVVGWLAMYAVHLEKALLEVAERVPEDQLRECHMGYLVYRVREDIENDQASNASSAS